jgi:hypothetical protein
MPKGGVRPGAGRKPGPSKATIEKRLIAERAVADALARRKPLAKEELEEVLPIVKGIVAHHQRAAMAVPGQLGDLKPFKEWLELFIDTCVRLAPYQSPTFKAVALTGPLGQSTEATIFRELMDEIDQSSRSRPLIDITPEPSR